MLWSLLLERRTLFGMWKTVNLSTVHHPDWISQSKCGVFGEDIENMETDLSDCIALTALYAMIKEGTAFPVASLLVFSTLAILKSKTSKWIRWTGWTRKKRLFWAGRFGWRKICEFPQRHWMIANPSGPYCLERSWQRFEKRATLLLFAGDFTDWKAGNLVLYLLPPIHKESSWWFLLLYPHWPAFVQGKELVGSTWNCWRHPVSKHTTNEMFFLEHPNEWSACPFVRWHWEVANFLGGCFCVASNASGEKSHVTHKFDS